MLVGTAMVVARGRTGAGAVPLQRTQALSTLKLPSSISAWAGCTDASLWACRKGTVWAPGCDALVLRSRSSAKQRSCRTQSLPCLQFAICQKPAICWPARLHALLDLHPNTTNLALGECHRRPLPPCSQQPLHPPGVARPPPCADLCDWRRICRYPLRP